MRQVYQFSFPAPSPTLALILVIWGTGICGTVSELRDGVEHKFSDLPRDEVCLVFWKLFSPFSVRWASATWRKTILISVRSTGPRPLVLNCAGLASVAATELDCWAGDRWGGSGMSTLAQPRWASFIWGHVLLPSWGTLACLSPGFARSQVGRYVILQRDVATRLSKSGGHEQFLVCSFSHSLQR